MCGLHEHCVCVFVCCIREQEGLIAKLRASERELRQANETLSNATEPLVTSTTQDHVTTGQSHVTTDSGGVEEDGGGVLNSSGNSTTLPTLPTLPTITRITATVDVDISSLPGNDSLPGNGQATATATIPLKFDSNYRTALEKGL